jgi:UDP-N-acetylglucosamine--N-acetylmuramyl-(pentapeptide) pyrophosphoryl-undecaprenol N-acetylglucosamine transferase
MKKLMIMAAGTGGHIFPGIAIAQTMHARGWEVSWLGTAHGMETDLVPKAGIPMDSIDFAGLRGKGLKHTITGAFKMLGSFVSCRRYLAKRAPSVVLGMGGYVTVPGGMMARSRGVPLALVNADAALLLSNKTLAPIAQRVLFGFPADFGKAAGKAVVTGNPVRQQILDLPAPGERFAGRTGPLRILVVGGSLGAKVLNDSVPAALSMLEPALRPVVTHQSGKKNIEALRAA